MTDFDNGLPPAGTVTDSKASGVLIESEPDKKAESNIVSGVLLDKMESESTDPAHIKTVLLCKEAAGINYGTFL